ncbi:MAG: hypothetical protein DBX46_05065 [Clostridiales bacterium]|nr:MAG: hypothetical protein DBX46_05065 [Clostridiales bacterium]
MQEQQTNKNILCKQGVYLPDGSVSNTKLNAISGVLTSQLIDNLLELIKDLTVFKGITAFWWELYEASDYSSLGASIKTSYLTAGLVIPEVIDAIFQSNDEALQEVYFYEFLMDTEETCIEYTEAY